MTALGKAWCVLSLALAAPVLQLGCAGEVGSAAGGSSAQPVAPAIVTQPADAIAVAGARATFAVVATGTTLRYQWSRDGVPVPGATAASYQTAALARAESGATFTVTLGNDAGEVTSRAARLTVSPATQHVIVTQPGPQTVPT